MMNLVVIPAFNEEEALAQTVAGLQALPDGYELLVVNDGVRACVSCCFLLIQQGENRASPGGWL